MSVELGADVLFAFDMYAVVIDQSEPRLPSMVGPFSYRDEAQDWAAVTIKDGSWEVRPMAWPVHRRTAAAYREGVQSVIQAAVDLMEPPRSDEQPDDGSLEVQR